eukprot:COSAG06_NODE_2155_length_7457_cov_2.421038_4_plen_61_part_00
MKLISVFIKKKLRDRMCAADETPFSLCPPPPLPPQFLSSSTSCDRFTVTGLGQTNRNLKT